MNVGDRGFKAREVCQTWRDILDRKSVHKAHHLAWIKSDYFSLMVCMLIYVNE
jgi:hypothetical protein